MSLLELLIVIAERKKVIFLVGAIFAVLSAVISLLLPVRYTATATILPPQQSSSLGATLAAQLGSMGGAAALAGSSLGIKNPTDTILAIMKSRSVEDSMIQRFGLAQEYHARVASDARKSLEKMIGVEGGGKDGLIHISAQDSDSRRAAELANGYVEEFRKFSGKLAITEASQRRLFFEQQLEGAKNNLAKAEEAMKRTEQQTGVIHLDSQARALIETAATLRAQIAAKEVQVESLETFATDQNSQVVQAQHELEGLRAELAKLGGSDSGDGGLLVPRGKVPQAGLEYERSLRDLKYYEMIFEILARQFEAAKLDEARQGALIQVVDPAVTPDRRSFPKRGMIVIACTFVGLLFGVALILAQAFLQNMRRESPNIARLTRLRRALSFRGASR